MSDLIRQLRHGGPPALAAAKALLEKKPKLTKAELAEVKLLLPKLKDLFGSKLSEGLSTLLSGFEAALPVPTASLMPMPEKVKDPAQLPARFATDLQLVRPQLVNHPALTREDKATRLFGFLVPFVQVVVKLPDEVKAPIAEQLAQNAHAAGFAQLVDVPTQRDGVQVAKELLRDAKTPEQVKEQVAKLKLDAPTWPDAAAPAPAHEQLPRTSEQRSPDAAPPSPDAAHASETRPPPHLAPSLHGASQRPLSPHPDPLPLGGEGGRANKRLGGKMIWNVLHLFRDDGAQGRDSAAQREELNRLAIGMGLALAMLTLLAIIFFGARAFGGTPTVDWSVFPEGKTMLRDKYVNRLRGEERITTWSVTRKGTHVDVEVETTRSGVMLRRLSEEESKPKLKRWATDSLTTLATGDDGPLGLRCTKKKLTVQSEDMDFSTTEDTGCDGFVIKGRSKHPKKVDALECRIIDIEEKMLFVPGRSIEKIYENNDCTMADGLRFLPAE